MNHVDTVFRCEKCGALVERIEPHPRSQGAATWRHVVPADHHAIPNGAKAVQS